MCKSDIHQSIQDLISFRQENNIGTNNIKDIVAILQVQQVLIFKLSMKIDVQTETIDCFSDFAKGMVKVFETEFIIDLEEIWMKVFKD